MATDTTKKKKKKKMKKSDWYFFIGLIVIALAAASYVLATWNWPSHDPKDLVGKWYFDTSAYNIESQEGYKKVSSVYYDFAEGDAVTLTNSASGQSSTGTYSVSGEKLTLTFSGSPEEFDFVIKGDKLTLGTGADTIELTRVK